MSKSLRIDDEAEDELAAAAFWYEQQRSGLGREFLRAIDTTIATIEAMPLIAALAPSVPQELGVQRDASDGVAA